MPCIKRACIFHQPGATRSNFCRWFTILEIIWGLESGVWSRRCGVDGDRRRKTSYTKLEMLDARGRYGRAEYEVIIVSSR